jgi:hypothetical protein
MDVMIINNHKSYMNPIPTKSQDQLNINLILILTELYKEKIVLLDKKFLLFQLN